MKSGIYKITCVRAGRAYVGSAKDIARRWQSHTAALRRGDHANIHLQRAWSKHGSEAFEFSIVELCPVADLVAREQVAISSTPRQFNICKVARSSLGIKRRPETLEKMAAAQTPEKRAALAARNRAASEGHREATRLANRQRQWTDAAKDKLRAATERQFATAASRAAHAETIKAGMADEAVRKKISIAAKKRAYLSGPDHPNYGRRHSEETRRVSSEAIKRSWSPERRAAQAARMMGNKVRANAANSKNLRG